MYYYIDFKIFFDAVFGNVSKSTGKLQCGFMGSSNFFGNFDFELVVGPSGPTVYAQTFPGF